MWLSHCDYFKLTLVSGFEFPSFMTPLLVDITQEQAGKDLELYIKTGSVPTASFGQTHEVEKALERVWTTNARFLLEFSQSTCNLATFVLPHAKLLMIVSF